MPIQHALTDTLLSASAHPERVAGLALYAFLVGRWRFSASVWPADGVPLHGEGRIAAGWVLDGRAIQDVWHLPGIFHGTTLRVYDAARDGWHILWSDPLHQYYGRQFGRAAGNDIVQLGHNDAGTPTRWSFRERSTDAFRWCGEVSDDDGTSWRREAEFICRREP